MNLSYIYRSHFVNKLVQIKWIEKLIQVKGINQLIQVNWIKRLIIGIRIISTEDQLFYPVILGPIYLLIGPWALGFIMEDFLGDSLGVLFYWGLYIEQTLVPSTVASIYALFYILPYIYMFVIYLAAVLGLLHDKTNTKTANCDRKLIVVISNILYCIFLMFQLYLPIDVYYSYGLLESLGVCGLWRLFYFGFIWKGVYSMMEVG